MCCVVIIESCWFQQQQFRKGFCKFRKNSKMLRGGMVDDTLSNLTSTISNEASISSTNNRNINELGPNNLYPHHHSLQPFPNNPATTMMTTTTTTTTQPPLKKKRSLPGHPDPDAEVVALSPTSLMATNRFVCEICNKGFQRDQNLQLHRRGHNLPWKLKQRNKHEVVKKKVYVCPETTCVHHDPSRALGDLTGIKKHFSRKHGEKKWKCDKCSKRYAVQSDWKAHSKICGTREYRCDCGTLFSRRDSFITHRAFCDALAEESSRSMTHPIPTPTPTTPTPLLSSSSFLHHHHPLIPLKQELNLPPWLSSSPSSEHLFPIQENPNPNFINSSSSSSSPSLMSATALLQKASQMGVTMSSKLGCQSSSDESILMRPTHVHVASNTNTNGLLPASSSTTTAVALPSREPFMQHPFPSFTNTNKNHLLIQQQFQHLNQIITSSSSSSSLPSTAGFDASFAAFDDTFNGIMNQKRSSMGGGEGLTRDFLGLRGFPGHRNFLDMEGLDQLGSSSYDQQAQQPPWQT